jgi:hypothetical protein
MCVMWQDACLYVAVSGPLPTSDVRARARGGSAETGRAFCPSPWPRDRGEPRGVGEVSEVSDFPFPSPGFFDSFLSEPAKRVYAYRRIMGNH